MVATVPTRSAIVANSTEEGRVVPKSPPLEGRSLKQEVEGGQRNQWIEPVGGREQSAAEDVAL